MSGAGPRGRVLWWGLCGLVAAAVLAYLHTGHAFRTVIVPLVEARIDGSLGVAGGSLHADGRIEAIGLAYRGRGIEVDVERAEIGLSPWSLLWGRVPRILWLSVRGVRIETRPPESGGGPTSDAIDAAPWPGVPGAHRAAPAFLEIGVEEGDLRPWLALYGLDPAYFDDPLPLDAGWKVWFERPRLGLRSQGWQTLGLRRFGLLEVRLEHRAMRSGSGVDEFELTLHGRRQQGPDDSSAISAPVSTTRASRGTAPRHWPSASSIRF